MSELQRRYSPDEVRTILGRALKVENHDGSVSLEELRATARELGIHPDAIDHAVAEHDAAALLAAARMEFRGLRRQRLARAVATWAAGAVGLGALDLLQGGALEWAPLPVCLWGMLVLFRMARTVFMTTEDEEVGAHKMLLERTRRQEKLLAARRD
ncbi:MAG: hypothetical protein HY904_02015 [Deltaproteobacteria bacterium]|nr:hypothetical protein [Deltaproteobacteria bacterium]